MPAPPTPPSGGGSGSGAGSGSGSGSGLDGSGTGGKPPTALVVRVSRARLAQALRRGLVVTVSTPRPGGLTVLAKAGNATVGSGRASAGAAGPVRVRVAFTRQSRTRLQGRKTVTLRLLITLRPGHGTATQTVRMGTSL